MSDCAFLECTFLFVQDLISMIKSIISLINHKVNRVNTSNKLSVVSHLKTFLHLQM